jgi:hypothetical protein
MIHMRVRANLPAAQAREILKYLEDEGDECAGARIDDYLPIRVPRLPVLAQLSLLNAKRD